MSQGIMPFRQTNPIKRGSTGIHHHNCLRIRIGQPYIFTGQNPRATE
ncbi:MAG: hypothetical protein ACUVRV_08385 [Cyanobacteriota bacterium]